MTLGGMSGSRVPTTPPAISSAAGPCPRRGRPRPMDRTRDEPLPDVIASAPLSWTGDTHADYATVLRDRRRSRHSCRPAAEPTSVELDTAEPQHRVTGRTSSRNVATPARGDEQDQRRSPARMRLPPSPTFIMLRRRFAGRRERIKE